MTDRPTGSSSFPLLEFLVRRRGWPLLAALGCLLTIAAPAEAQWTAIAPVLGASATVQPIPRFNAATAVNLTTGTQDIIPGVPVVIPPFGNDPAVGTGAKLDITFSIGTKVTVAATTLSATINSVTYTMTPQYVCAIAEDQAGTNETAFPSTCADGYEWPNAAVTGTMNRTVGVGIAIPASETDTKLPGTYTGSITFTVSASSS